MKIIVAKQIDVNKFTAQHSAFFVRIDPEDLSLSVLEILQDLANLSWLNTFDRESVKNSFKSRATKTCDDIKCKLVDANTNTPLIDEAGEYIVSCLAKKALVSVYAHKDIPLAELLGRKISNNPGFDFYTEKDGLLTAGEAKYIKGVNAYNSSLSQVNKFISKKKHIDDLALLFFFVPDESLDNMNKGNFSIGAAFSVTDIETEKLIMNILKNNAFEKTIQNHSIFLLAVNMYE